MQTQSQIVEPPLGPFESIEENRVELLPLCEQLAKIAGREVASGLDALTTRAGIISALLQMSIIVAEDAVRTARCERKNAAAASGLFAEGFDLSHEALDVLRVTLWKAEDAVRGELAEKRTVAEVVANYPLKTIREDKRKRHPYELTQRTLLDSFMDDGAEWWKLVEGYWRGTDREHEFYVRHTWLECGTVVYDAVENLYIDRQHYRSKFGAFGVKEFESVVAAANIWDMAHWEPLDDFGPTVLPFEDGTSPALLFPPKRIIFDCIDLSAEEWQLLPGDYTDDDEPIYTAETIAAADALNEAFNGALARDLDERETRHTMLDAIEEHTGGCDTEIRYVLGELLLERFGAEVCEASGWNAWNNFGRPEHYADRERWQMEKRGN